MELSKAALPLNAGRGSILAPARTRKTDAEKADRYADRDDARRQWDSCSYTPDGMVERVIDMPVKKVTGVMFGGPNLDVLYVASMAKPPLPRIPRHSVLRGSLLAIYDLGIRGVPEPRFAG